VPVAAMVGRREIVGRFGAEIPYFNTFGGSSVPVAAAQAVLDVIQDEGLAERAETLGRAIRGGVRALAGRYAAIGDVRGAGLFLGIEIVSDRDGGTPDSALALDIVNTLRDLGVLVSVAGPHNNVLKVRPLLVWSDADAAVFLERLDEALALSAGPAPL
jgi:4-aminobutyrate aminotransferase-like enzyme